MPTLAESLQHAVSSDVLEYLSDDSLSKECIYQALNLEKCIISKCTDLEEPDAVQKTIEGFLESNQLCERWLPGMVPDKYKLLVGEFRSIAYGTDAAFLHVSHAQMFQHGMHGGGRASGTDGRTFYQKTFASALTTSHEYLPSLYRRYISNFPEWSLGEKTRADAWGDVKLVAGSKLSTVPKKRTVRRTTCKEPSLDMFFQLGLGGIIETALKRLYKCSLDTQPAVNRQLALVGSMEGTYATIDLKNASDRIPLKMAQVFFPVLTGLINSVSSRRTEYEGQFIDLHMLSTMGNGTTFPFQTLLFSTVVEAAYRTVFNTRRRGRGGRDWGVFGDDIVVPTELYDHVVWLCEYLGFTVNLDKSFSTGSFRESCGGDYMNGVPVRGVYIKSLKQPHLRYNAVNRLMEWSAYTGIPLYRAIAVLLSGLPTRAVPVWYDVNGGVRMPFALTSFITDPRVVRPNGRIAFRVWKQRTASERHDMVGDGGLYVAFLGGYLRTPERVLDESRGRLFARGIKCVEQGELGLPSDEDGDWSLRHVSAPASCWDGQQRVLNRGYDPGWTRRYENIAMHVALRYSPGVTSPLIG